MSSSVTGRRLPPVLTRFADFSRWKADVGRLLDDALSKLGDTATGVPREHAEHHMGGDDDVMGSATPQDVALGGSGAVGDPTAGGSPIGHIHALGVAVPVDVALSNAAGSASTAVRSDHVHGTPQTTNGDLLTVIAAALARLAIGSAGEILTVASGLPSWAALGTQPFPIVEKSGAYTLTASDYTCLVNASGGEVTITLPTAAAGDGHIYCVKKIDASVNKAILDASGAETIDGDGNMELLLQHESVHVQSDGTEWWIL